MNDAKIIAEICGLDVAEVEQRIAANLLAEREKFEAAFEPDENNRKALMGYRHGDGYGYVPWATYIKGCWWGWQQKARLTGNDPFIGFMLEAANEGELAAYDYGCRSCELAVWNILNEDDTGAGRVNEPWGTLRKQLLEMKAKADLYDWLASQRGLELVSERNGSAWKRADGSMFFASHRLAVGDTQFSAQETLDATIACARAVQESRRAIE